MADAAPEYELIPVEDVFFGLRGTWSVSYDIDWVDGQPGDDFRTFPKARVRLIELDGPEHPQPYRFAPSQIDAETLALLQDLCDDQIEEMGI